MGSRNSQIVSKGFRYYFLSVILLMIAEQVSATVDMILVGNYVGGDAFAALDLVLPVESLVRGMGLLFAGGAGLIAARNVGNQEFAAADKVLYVAVISSVLCAVLVTVVSYIFFDGIVRILCPDADLSPHLESYLRIYLIGLMIITLYNSLCVVLDVYGKPSLITITAIFACVVDIVLDVVFMKHLGMGTEGQAYATLIAYLIPVLIFIPYLLGHKKVPAKIRRQGGRFIPVLKGNIVAGVQHSMPLVITFLIQYIINSISLQKLGNDGLFVWSVGYQLLSIGIMIVDAIGGTILATMGSMYVGSHDAAGLKALLKRCVFACLICILPLIGLACAFPTAIFTLFGEEDLPDIVHENRDLIMIVLLTIPYSLAFMKVYLDLALEREKSAMIATTTFFVSLIATTLIWARIEPAGIFIALLVAAAAYTLIDMVFFLPKIEIPDADKDDILYISIPYTVEGRDLAIAELDEFISARELDPSAIMAINICCEELMFNEQKFNDGKGKGFFYDFFILDDKEEIKVTVKDAGHPFNPIRKFAKPADEDDISLLVLNKMCKELNYNYMFGQNIISMTFRNER